MKFFTIKELTKTNTGISNVPTQEVTQNLIALIENVLDPIRERTGEPIYVSSGYRCEAVNKKVGGVKNSQHLTGEAADITLKNKKNNARLFAIIKDMGKFNLIEYDQLIWEKGNKNYPDWVHISYKQNGGNRKQVVYCY